MRGGIEKSLCFPLSFAVKLKFLLRNKVLHNTEDMKVLGFPIIICLKCLLESEIFLSFFPWIPTDF